MSEHTAENDVPEYRRPIKPKVRMSYMGSVSILVHRVLAQHGPGVVCAACPGVCNHCGNVGKAGEDHTCPCPFSDDECPDHTRVFPPAKSQGDAS